MATFQDGNPIPRHVDDALKREDHATSAIVQKMSRIRKTGGELIDNVAMGTGTGLVLSIALRLANK